MSTNGRAAPRRSCRSWQRALGDGDRQARGCQQRLLAAAGDRGRAPARGAKASGTTRSPVLTGNCRRRSTVTDALDIDVTGGEQDWDLATWARMIEMRAVDIVQPDVMYMGGIAPHAAGGAHGGRGRACRARRTAPISRSSPCARCTCWAPFRMPASISSSRSRAPDYYPWQEGLFLNDPYRVSEGHVTIPSEPGGVRTSIRSG